MAYIRTEVADIITVRSIITIHEIDLRTFNTINGESHNFPELIYLREGFSDMLIGGIPFRLEAGQILLVPPNAFHGPVDPNCRGTGVHTIFSFDSDSPLLPALYNRIITLSKDKILQYLALIEKGMGLFESAPPNSKQSGMVRRDEAEDYAVLALKKQWELFLASLYYDYVPAALIKRQRQKEKMLADFTVYLKAHLHEKVTLSQMERHLGVSRSTLRRLVSELCGCSPLNYFLELKFKEAKRLIGEGALTFTEIADRLGFETIHYFSRQFKKHTGYSPREYSKQYTQKTHSD